MTGGSRPAAIDGLAGLAESLGVPVVDDRAETAREVKSAIARSDGRWLLLMDNITDPAEIDAALSALSEVAAELAVFSDGKRAKR